MAITGLYRNYFQKSRIFLYPLLEIKRGVSSTPIETYLCWDNQFSFEDRKLICHYYLRTDAEFAIFEKQHLFNNKLFFDFKPISNTEGIYIFDLSKNASDYDKIIEGKYSKLSEEHKKKIIAFYGKYDSNFAYIESFLYPKKYMNMYSEMLNVKLSVLKHTGELCSSIDTEKETLKLCLQNLEVNSKLI